MNRQDLFKQGDRVSKFAQAVGRKPRLVCCNPGWSGLVFGQADQLKNAQGLPAVDSERQNKFAKVA